MLADGPGFGAESLPDGILRRAYPRPPVPDRAGKYTIIVWDRQAGNREIRVKNWQEEKKY